MTRRTAALLFASLGLIGCASRTPPRRYDMQGEIKGLDPAAKTATIQAGKIGDWMEAMTMDYKIQPDAEFQKLHVGDRIEAKVVVQDDASYYVTDVKVVK